MVPRHALAAVHTATGIPADSNTLAHLDSFGIGADRCHAADYLLSKNCRVL